MTEYDYGDVPVADVDPTEYVKTKCLYGPWHGALITHLPGDRKPRMVETDKLTGEYRFDGVFWLWYVDE